VTPDSLDSSPNVRFGSKADIGLPPIDVRFVPILLQKGVEGLLGQ
jgi:hypothetical protein